MASKTEAQEGAGIMQPPAEWPALRATLQRHMSMRPLGVTQVATHRGRAELNVWPMALRWSRIWGPSMIEFGFGG